jgi:hypothetical protein
LHFWEKGSKVQGSRFRVFKGEPQNFRILNRRESKGIFALLNLFIKKIEFIPSTFDINPPSGDSQLEITVEL